MLASIFKYNPCHDELGRFSTQFNDKTAKHVRLMEEFSRSVGGSPARRLRGNKGEKPVVRMLAPVLKANPYHDELGRFTTKEGAVNSSDAKGFSSSKIKELEDFMQEHLGGFGGKTSGDPMIDFMVRPWGGTAEKVDVVGEKWPRAVPNHCYSNAFNYVFQSPGTRNYVLGYYQVYGVPIAHAWCKEGEKHVDITLAEGPSKGDYYKVAEFDAESLLDFVDSNDGYPPDFDNYVLYLRRKDKVKKGFGLVLKANPCHQPAGSSIGGQFCSSGNATSPNFKEWFGNGTFVRNGKPQVLYHGTRNNFGVDPQFKIPTEGLIAEQIGIHLAKDPRVSDAFTIGAYAKDTDYNPWDKDSIAGLSYESRFGYQAVAKPGGHTMPLYTSAEKVLVIPQKKNKHGILDGDDQSVTRFALGTLFREDKALFEEYVNHRLNAPIFEARDNNLWERLANNEPVYITSGSLHVSVPKEYINNNDGDGFRAFVANYGGDFGPSKDGKPWATRIAEKFRSWASREGYDAIEYQNTSTNEVYGDIDPTCYIILDPKKIKSAIGNDGTYGNHSYIMKVGGLASILKANPCHEPAGSPRGGQFCSGGGDDQFNYPEDDLDYAETKEDIKVILDHYKAEKIDQISTEGNSVYVLHDQDIIVEWDSDTWASASDREEWVNEANVFEYLPEIEDQFNKDFWEYPRALYHNTQTENVESILKNGLNMMDKSRGLTNRSVGSSVFTSMNNEEYALGEYGDAQFSIDMAAMKKDGYTPYVGLEPNIVEGDARGALANLVGLDDYEVYYENDGTSPETVIVYGPIDPKYLTLETEMPEEIYKLGFASVLKRNDCHKPAGSPAGGQFCSKDKSLPDTLDVGGVQRSTSNSDGQPIHSTEDGVRNFWKWFGRSRAVDGKGSPLVVYRGDDSDFSMPIGLKWFSDRKSLANDYALGKQKFNETGTGGQVIPAYISVKNPLRLDKLGLDMNHRMPLSQLRELLPFPLPNIKYVTDGEFSEWGTPQNFDVWNLVNTKEFAEAAKLAGYDGIRVNEDGKKTWGVFDQTQVKSAIGNSGGFDPKNKIITKASGFSKVLKLNDCHVPAGSSAGGQFCSSEAAPTRYDYRADFAVGKKIYPNQTYSPRYLLPTIESRGKKVTIGFEGYRNIRMPKSVELGMPSIIKSLRSTLRLEGYDLNVYFTAADGSNSGWGGLANGDTVQIKQKYLREVINAQKAYEKNPTESLASNASTAWHELAELMGHEFTHIHQSVTGKLSWTPEEGTKWNGKARGDRDRTNYQNLPWANRPWEKEANAFQGPLGKRVIDDLVGQGILPTSFSRLDTETRFSNSARDNESNRRSVRKGGVQLTASGFSAIFKKNPCHHPAGSGRGGQFCSLDSTNTSHAERAKSLRIPPGVKNVRLNVDPKAALQARWTDSKGRECRLYSQDHVSMAAQRKWQRVKDFHKSGVAQQAREAAVALMQDEGSPKALRDTAAVLALIAKTGFRTGSERERGGSEKAYGASTLLGQHVQVNGDELSFSFAGKHGVKIEKKLVDKDLASYIASNKAAAGNDGRLFDTSSRRLSTLFDKLAGKDYKIKDYRTWIATSTALKVIKSEGIPESSAKARKIRALVGKTVAAELGNTPTVALNSYVPPFVFEPWGEFKPVKKAEDLDDYELRVALLDEAFETIFVEPQLKNRRDKEVTKSVQLTAQGFSSILKGVSIRGVARNPCHKPAGTPEGGQFCSTGSGLTPAEAIKEAMKYTAHDYASNFKKARTAGKLMTQAYSKWWGELNYHERVSIAAYVGDTVYSTRPDIPKDKQLYNPYIYINNALRGQERFKSDAREWINGIDSAMAKAGRTPEDMYVYRGFFTPKPMDFKNGGLAFTDEGFMSTSITPNEAAEYDVNANEGLTNFRMTEQLAPGKHRIHPKFLLRIKVPKGSKALYAPTLENEVLLDRNSRIKVSDKSELIKIKPKGRRSGPATYVRIFEAELVSQRSKPKVKLPSKRVRRWTMDEAPVPPPKKRSRRSRKFDLGLSSIFKRNPCHHPAGSPQGGQFCSATGGPLVQPEHENIANDYMVSRALESIGFKTARGWKYGAPVSLAEGRELSRSPGAEGVRMAVGLMLESTKELPEDAQKVLRGLKPRLALSYTEDYKANGTAWINGHVMSLNYGKMYALATGNALKEVERIKSQEEPYSLSASHLAGYDHDKPWKSVKDAFKSVVKHEIGHLLTSDQSIKDFRGALQENLGNEPKAIKEWITDNVSEYATYNARELIAESFAKYHGPKFDKSTYPDWFRKVIEELPVTKRSSRGNVTLKVAADTFEPLEDAPDFWSDEWFSSGQEEEHQPAPTESTKKSLAFILKANDCHLPGGSPEGGRFCSKDKDDLWKQSKPEWTPEMREEYERVKDLEFNSDEYQAFQAKMDDVRDRRRVWEGSVLRAISRGELDPNKAEEVGFYFSGSDRTAYGPLPDELYHVTTAVDLVAQNGLKTREELGQASGLGLGGGASDTISFTTDPKIAQGIVAAMHLARDYFAGEVSTQDLIDRARKGDGGSAPFLDDLNRQNITGYRDIMPGEDISLSVYDTLHGTKSRMVGEYWKEGMMVMGDLSGKDSEWKVFREAGDKKVIQRKATPEEAQSMKESFFKAFMLFRESKGGPLDPLFFSSDLEGLGKVPKDQIKAIKFKAKDGSVGYKVSALGEWRTHTGSVVSLDKVYNDLGELERLGIYKKERSELQLIALPGLSSIFKSNDCHHPAGSSKGGQFCSSSGWTAGSIDRYVDFSRPNSRVNSQDILEDLREQYPDEIANIEAGLKEAYSAEYVSVYLATNDEVIEGVLLGGEFQNSLQAGTGTFLMHGKRRVRLEKAYLGVKATINEPENFPKYGFVATKDFMDWDPVVGFGYGDIFVEFDDSVRDSTTITIGDSLNNNHLYDDRFRLPAPIDNPSAAQILGQPYSDLREFVDKDRYVDFNRALNAEYTEAQIYGKLDASKIKAIHVVDRFTQSWLQGIVGETGLDIEVTILTEDRYTNDY